MNKDKRFLYQARRAKVAQMIGDAAFILRSASEVTRNSDVTYPFRQESSFLYLTGWTHPDAFLLIEGGEHPRSTIFFDSQSDHDRLWNGKIPTHEDAVQDYGFNEAYACTGKFARALSDLAVFSEQQNIPIYLTESESTLDSIQIEDLPLLQHLHGAYQIRDGNTFLSALRVIKDKTEVATMRRAARISGIAHRDLMRLTRPGMYEYEVAAMFAYLTLRHGTDPQHAYPSIVAAGENSCTLHYVKRSAKIGDGDLVLVDAGCEVEGYASDITRTFPANGVFSPAQRVLYKIVLHAQKSAIAAAKRGNIIGNVHRTAALTLADGLIREGILKDPDPESAIRTESIKRFFPHGTSHWLGLDVHDVGDYEKDEGHGRYDGRRELLPGMVMTVEPGIYIPKDMQNIDARFRGIGIRIEDDVLITESGNEVLSRSAPKEIDDIEVLMSGKFK
jgi:Xaa-Pro aminopeptidase